MKILASIATLALLGSSTVLATADPAALADGESYLVQIQGPDGGPTRILGTACIYGADCSASSTDTSYIVVGVSCDKGSVGACETQEHYAVEPIWVGVKVTIHGTRFEVVRHEQNGNQAGPHDVSHVPDTTAPIQECKNTANVALGPAVVVCGYHITVTRLDEQTLTGAGK